MWLRGRKTGFKLELTVDEPITFPWVSVSPLVKDHDAGKD